MSEKKKGRFVKFLGFNILYLFVFVTLITFFSGGCFVAFQLGHYIADRNHGNVNVESYEFTESAKELKNPYRGFYYMYGFVANEEEIDYEKEVKTRIGSVQSMTMAMVQINLREYNDRPLSQAALDNIEELFCALEKQDKEYLIRFLYDWSGKNSETEPAEVEIILTHMRQLEETLRAHKDIIYIHQGLFIGNWGEMNGTQHLPYMQELALQLASVTDESTFLAVRMPAQWRKITETADPKQSSWENDSIAHRLSLFNDGMLGNIGDYGTYGTVSREEVGDFTHWNREEELAFQNELCKVVPNGGEVIVENPVNDFENAIADMTTMHVSYLNRDYDQAVLDKWAETIITEEGCFNGMDGLTYVERHLGYRLLIHGTDMDYDLYKDKLVLEVTLQNVGFAPLYRKPELYAVISNAEGTLVRTYPIDADVRVLTGGNQAEQLLPVQAVIELSGYEAGEYNVYFYIQDPASGKRILLANEQEEETLGYKVGHLNIEPIKNPFTGENLEIDNLMQEWLIKYTQ